MFDVVLFVVLLVAIAGLARIAYELGVDDGWTESGNWADKHGVDVRFTMDSAIRRAESDLERELGLPPDRYAEFDTRPATRDKDA